MAILPVGALKDGEDEDNEILALDSTALTTFTQSRGQTPTM
jgi:hypothetical protein